MGHSSDRSNDEEYRRKKAFVFDELRKLSKEEIVKFAKEFVDAFCVLCGDSDRECDCDKQAIDTVRSIVHRVV